MEESAIALEITMETEPPSRMPRFIRKKHMGFCRDDREGPRQSCQIQYEKQKAMENLQSFPRSGHDTDSVPGLMQHNIALALFEAASHCWLMFIFLLICCIFILLLSPWRSVRFSVFAALLPTYNCKNDGGRNWSGHNALLGGGAASVWLLSCCAISLEDIATIWCRCALL